MLKKKNLNVAAALWVAMSAFAPAMPVQAARSGMDDVGVAGVEDNGTRYQRSERQSRTASREAPSPAATTANNQEGTVPPMPSVQERQAAKAQAMRDAAASRPQMPSAAEAKEGLATLASNKDTGVQPEANQNNGIPSDYKDPDDATKKKAVDFCVEKVTEIGTKDPSRLNGMFPKDFCSSDSSSAVRVYAFCLANKDKIDGATQDGFCEQLFDDILSSGKKDTTAKIAEDNIFEGLKDAWKEGNLFGFITEHPFATVGAGLGLLVSLVAAKVFGAKAAIKGMKASASGIAGVTRFFEKHGWKSVAETLEKRTGSKNIVGELRSGMREAGETFKDKDAKGKTIDCLNPELSQFSNTELANMSNSEFDEFMKKGIEFQFKEQGKKITTEAVNDEISRLGKESFEALDDNLINKMNRVDKFGKIGGIGLGGGITASSVFGGAMSGNSSASPNAATESTQKRSLAETMGVTGSTPATAASERKASGLEAYREYINQKHMEEMTKIGQSFHSNGPSDTQKMGSMAEEAFKGKYGFDYQTEENWIRKAIVENKKEKK